MKSKKNMFIRILSMLSVFMLLLNMMPMTSNAAAHDPNDGEYGDELRFWEDEEPDVGFYINAASRYILETVEEPAMGTNAGEWSVMNLLRGMYTGYDYLNDIEDDYFEGYIDRIQEFVADQDGDLHRHKSTEWSRLILALSSLDYDITDVAGYDFIEKLSESYPFSYRQGINGPIWEIIAMNTGDYNFYQDDTNPDVNTYGKMIDHILELEIEQNDGTIGGWALANFGGASPDPDITGMALQALAPYYNNEDLYNETDAEASYEDLVTAVERALVVMDDIQAENGAYKAFNNVNVESTVQVLVALTELGMDPLADTIELENIGEEVSFVTDGGTEDGVKTDNIVDALLTFWAEGSGSELGVGGFKHVTSGDDGGGGAGNNVNDMATDQSLYGLIAYDRFVKDEAPLYDMTDMMAEYDGKPYTEYEAKEVEVQFEGFDDQQTLNKSPYEIVEIPSEEDTEGREFTSWNTESDGSGTDYYPDENLSIPDHDVTLYAQANYHDYRIEYETNDGTLNDDKAPNSYTVDDEVDLPTADDIEKEGYDFAGWYDNKEYKGDDITVIPSGSYGDKTFYAKWSEEEKEPEIKTNLEDGLITKADKLTFDLWAKDEDGKKIDPSNIEVTNNDTSVPVNWDDNEKTSYTLGLEEGENNIKIIVNANETLEYTIEREPAKDGDVIGTYTFSLEAFTIGLGHLVEPIQYDIIKGENAVQALDRALKENGFDYEYTGTMTDSFYLSYLMDDENTIYKENPKIPEKLKEALNGNYNEESYQPGFLGEFDFSFSSGWMYSVNNFFPNVGFADHYLSDGDVMRTQFTLALGADIGGGASTDFYEVADKDRLTEKVAEINSSDEKDNYLEKDIQKEAYDHAIDTLEQVDASQSKTDEALQQITDAEAQVKNNEEAVKEVENKINDLPSVEELTLEDSQVVQEALEAYEELSKDLQNLVENSDELEELEKQLNKLEEENAADEEAVKEVEDKINVLPSAEELTLEDSQAVQEALEAYEGLSEDRQDLVENSDKLEELEKQLNKLEEENAANEEAVKEVEDKINDLPSVEELTLEDGQAVQEALDAYNKLTKDQQELVKNSNELEKLEEQIKKLEEKTNGEEAVKEVEEKINSLPSAEELTLEDKEEVEAARKAFDTLSEKQQERVTNVERLEKLESGLKELSDKKDKEKAEEVEKLIDSLPDVDSLTLEDKNAVLQAQKELNELTEEQKSYLTNGDDLSDELDKLVKQLSELETAAESADKSGLESLVEKAKGMDLDGKTKESKDSLNQFIKDAESILADPNVSEEDVNKAMKELENALTGLEEEKQEQEDEETKEEATENEDDEPGNHSNPETENQPGEESSEGTQSEGEEIDKGNQEPNEEAKTQGANKLPATATNNFNYIIAGLILILTGLTLFYIRRKRSL